MLESSGVRQKLVRFHERRGWLLMKVCPNLGQMMKMHGGGQALEGNTAVSGSASARCWWISPLELSMISGRSKQKSKEAGSAYRRCSFGWEKGNSAVFWVSQMLLALGGQGEGLRSPMRLAAVQWLAAAAEVHASVRWQGSNGVQGTSSPLHSAAHLNLSQNNGIIPHLLWNVVTDFCREFFSRSDTYILCMLHK